MHIYIFLYNVVPIKSDFLRLQFDKSQKMILIGSPYCLKDLSFRNRCCFDKIFEVSRDFHQIDQLEIEPIILSYVEKYGSKNIHLLSNEDSTQLVCAAIREKYGISGAKQEKVLPFINKVISKEKLKNKVKTPKFIKFDKLKYVEGKEDYLNNLVIELGFPMFAKPVDLVSSIQTHYIADYEKLKYISEHILHHSYEFEIDEYINGDLFYCDAIVINGAIKFFAANRYGFPLVNFFNGKFVGSMTVTDPVIYKGLEDFSNIVFKQLNCSSGVYHMEVFLEKKSQKFVFLEIHSRTPGALAPKFYEKSFNFNIEEAHYLAQAGKLRNTKFTKTGLYVGWANFPFIPGKLLYIKHPELNIEYEFTEFVKPNQILKKAENLLDVSYSIFFWDKSHEKVTQAFEFLKNYQPLVMHAEEESKHESQQKNLLSILNNRKILSVKGVLAN